MQTSSQRYNVLRGRHLTTFAAHAVKQVRRLYVCNACSVDCYKFIPTYFSVCSFICLSRVLLCMSTVWYMWHAACVQSVIFTQHFCGCSDYLACLTQLIKIFCTHSKGNQMKFHGNNRICGFIIKLDFFSPHLIPLLAGSCNCCLGFSMHFELDVIMITFCSQKFVCMCVCVYVFEVFYKAIILALWRNL